MHNLSTDEQRLPANLFFPFSFGPWRRNSNDNNNNKVFIYQKMHIVCLKRELIRVEGLIWVGEESVKYSIDIGLTLEEIKYGMA